jgi:hypothetical protein
MTTDSQNTVTSDFTPTPFPQLRYIYPMIRLIVVTTWTHLTCFVDASVQYMSHSVMSYVPSDAAWPSIKMCWGKVGNLQGLLSPSNSSDAVRSLPNRSTTWNVLPERRSKFVSETLKQRINYVIYCLLVPNLMHYPKQGRTQGRRLPGCRPPQTPENQN